MFLWVIISSRVYIANNFFKNLFFNSAIVLCANFDPLKVPALPKLGSSNHKANLILDSSNIIFLPCMRDQRSYSSISLGKEMLQEDQINSSVWTVKDTCPLSFGCWIAWFISSWEGNNCLKRWAFWIKIGTVFPHIVAAATRDWCIKFATHESPIYDPF